MTISQTCSLFLGHPPVLYFLPFILRSSFSSFLIKEPLPCLFLLSCFCHYDDDFAHFFRNCFIGDKMRYWSIPNYSLDHLYLRRNSKDLKASKFLRPKFIVSNKKSRTWQSDYTHKYSNSHSKSND